MIAIDPGASGAIVWYDADGIVRACNMPGTYPEIADMLLDLRSKFGYLECVLEKVGTYVPGNSGPAAAKFARHCGHIEASLYCLGIPTKQVTPSVWKKKLGALPKDKKARKNKIKEMMAARYPHLRVTLKNADALGIITVEMQERRLTEF